MKKEKYRKAPAKNCGPSFYPWSLKTRIMRSISALFNNENFIDVRFRVREPDGVVAIIQNGDIIITGGLPSFKVYQQ